MEAVVTWDPQGGHLVSDASALATMRRLVLIKAENEDEAGEAELSLLLYELYEDDCKSKSGEEFHSAAIVNEKVRIVSSLLSGINFTEEQREIVLGQLAFYHTNSVWRQAQDLQECALDLFEELCYAPTDWEALVSSHHYVLKNLASIETAGKKEMGLLITCLKLARDACWSLHLHKECESTLDALHTVTEALGSSSSAVTLQLWHANFPTAKSDFLLDEESFNVLRDTMVEQQENVSIADTHAVSQRANIEIPTHSQMDNMDAQMDEEREQEALRLGMNRQSAKDEELIMTHEAKLIMIRESEEENAEKFHQEALLDREQSWTSSVTETKECFGDRRDSTAVISLEILRQMQQSAEEYVREFISVFSDPTPEEGISGLGRFLDILSERYYRRTHLLISTHLQRFLEDAKRIDALHEELQDARIMLERDQKLEAFVIQSPPLLRLIEAVKKEIDDRRHVQLFVDFTEQCELVPAYTVNCDEISEGSASKQLFDYARELDRILDAAGGKNFQSAIERAKALPSFGDLPVIHFPERTAVEDLISRLNQRASNVSEDCRDKDAEEKLVRSLESSILRKTNWSRLSEASVRWLNPRSVEQKVLQSDVTQLENALSASFMSPPNDLLKRGELLLRLRKAVFKNVVDNEANQNVELVEEIARNWWETVQVPQSGPGNAEIMLAAEMEARNAFVSFLLADSVPTTATIFKTAYPTSAIDKDDETSAILRLNSAHLDLQIIKDDALYWATLHTRHADQIATLPVLSQQCEDLLKTLLVSLDNASILAGREDEKSPHLSSSNLSRARQLIETSSHRRRSANEQSEDAAKGHLSLYKDHVDNNKAGWGAECPSNIVNEARLISFTSKLRRDALPLNEERFATPKQRQRIAVFEKGAGHFPRQNAAYYNHKMVEDLTTTAEDLKRCLINHLQEEVIRFGDVGKASIEASRVDTSSAFARSYVALSSLLQTTKDGEDTETRSALGETRKVAIEEWLLNEEDPTLAAIQKRNSLIDKFVNIFWPHTASDPSQNEELLGFINFQQLARVLTETEQAQGKPSIELMNLIEIGAALIRLRQAVAEGRWFDEEDEANMTVYRILESFPRTHCPRRILTSLQDVEVELHNVRVEGKLMEVISTGHAYLGIEDLGSHKQIDIDALEKVVESAARLRHKSPDNSSLLEIANKILNLRRAVKAGDWRSIRFWIGGVLPSFTHMKAHCGRAYDAIYEVESLDRLSKRNAQMHASLSSAMSQDRVKGTAQCLETSGVSVTNLLAALRAASTAPKISLEDEQLIYSAQKLKDVRVCFLMYDHEKVIEEVSSINLGFLHDSALEEIYLVRRAVDYNSCLCRVRDLLADPQREVEDLDRALSVFDVSSNLASDNVRLFLNGAFAVLALRNAIREGNWGVEAVCRSLSPTAVPPQHFAYGLRTVSFTKEVFGSPSSSPASDHSIEIPSSLPVSGGCDDLGFAPRSVDYTDLPGVAFNVSSSLSLAPKDSVASILFQEAPFFLSVSEDELLFARDELYAKVCCSLLGRGLVPGCDAELENAIRVTRHFGVKSKTAEKYLFTACFMKSLRRSSESGETKMTIALLSRLGQQGRSLAKCVHAEVKSIFEGLSG